MLVLRSDAILWSDDQCLHSTQCRSMYVHRVPCLLFVDQRSQVSIDTCALLLNVRIRRWIGMQKAIRYVRTRFGTEVARQRYGLGRDMHCAVAVDFDGRGRRVGIDLRLC